MGSGRERRRKRRRGDSRKSRIESEQTVEEGRKQSRYQKINQHS
jgi:hypothetical protein